MLLPYSAGFSKAFFSLHKLNQQLLHKQGCKIMLALRSRLEVEGWWVRMSLFFEEEHQQADVMRDVQGLKASAIGL